MLQIKQRIRNNIYNNTKKKEEIAKRKEKLQEHFGWLADGNERQTRFS